MGSTTRSSGSGDRPPARTATGGLSRRGLLAATGAVGSAALTGTLPLVGPPGAWGEAADPLPAEEQAMVLQVARVGATAPFSFPAFGERGSASSRATPDRLHAAARRLPAERRAQARAGAARLIGAGLLDAGREQLLAGIGGEAMRAAATAEADGPATERDLVAVVALAIATVSRHFDPASDHPAGVWVGSLRRLAERGERPLAVRHLEAR